MHEEHEMIASVSNAEDLLNILASIDISVPKRTEGRKTKHAERYTVCMLISTLSKTECLEYPLSLISRDRPDFQLLCNGMDIGIEITESTSEDYSSYIALLEREKPDHFIEPSHFLCGEKLTLEQKRNILNQEKITGMLWGDDEPEQEWFKFIKCSIKEKIKKLSKNEFKKFNKNWLSVYDNTPLCCINKEYIFPHLKNLWPSDDVFCFDRIFIESRWIENDSPVAKPIIISLSKEGAEYFPVEDVWEKAA